MNRSCSPSSSRFLFLPVMESHNSPLAAGCFIPARLMTSRSEYNKQRRKHASRLFKLARLSIHIIASWSVRIEKHCPSRYGWKSNMDQTVTMHSCCMVSYCCLVSVSKRDQ